jgi:arylsulfatase
MIKKIKLILVLIAALITSFTSAQITQQPNIIFILTDDLGYGDLGCFGSKLNRTPNLDKLAENGIRFTDCYSAASICSPSRAGLLTGRYPVRMGINGVFFPESFSGLPASEITISEVLKKAGYYTGMVGKWHLGHHHQFLPLQNGFNEYFGIPYSNDMRSVVYFRGNEVESWQVDQTQLTKTYTKEAVQFIERNKQKPFFLYLSHNMPHVPLFASEQFKGKSANGLYGDVIEELDWSVGEIVKKLTELGLEENTLVIFTSDNGPWLTEGPHGGSSGTLFQGKFTSWEGGQRVPNIAYWKGKLKPLVCAEVTSLLDWFPTLITLAGEKIPNDRIIDGKNLTDLLLKNEKPATKDFCYIHYGKIEAYRSGDYKIIMPKPLKKGNFWVEDVPAHDTLLFNLKNDPGEKTDLFHSESQKAKEMAQKVADFRQSLFGQPPGMIMNDRSAEDFTVKTRKELIDEAVKNGQKPKGGN